MVAVGLWAIPQSRPFLFQEGPVARPDDVQNLTGWQQGRRGLPDGPVDGACALAAAEDEQERQSILQLQSQFPGQLLPGCLPVRERVEKLGAHRVTGDHRLLAEEAGHLGKTDRDLLGQAAEPAHGQAGSHVRQIDHDGHRAHSTGYGHRRHDIAAGGKTCLRPEIFENLQRLSDARQHFGQIA